MTMMSPGTAGTGAEPPPTDRILFEGDIATVGAFRAAPNHPHFRDSGPTEHTIFVFPRTSVVIRHEGRPPFVTDTRTVTYYNRAQRYTRAPVDELGDRCEWFALRPDVLRDALARHDPAVADRESHIFPFTHGPSDVGSYALQRLVVRHLAESEAPDALLVEEMLMEVLARVSALAYRGAGERSGSGEAACGTRSRALARSVRELVLARMTTADSLGDIGAAVGASVFHLCRVFKRETGTTIHRYRDELRLRRSLELVAESEDLTRVALGLGYSHHSHFTASFRRMFAVTPSEFRRSASARRVRELRERMGAVDLA